MPGKEAIVATIATIRDVETALSRRADEYRERISILRKQLRDEGKDAVDPGHSAGANDIKFNIECVETLLNMLPRCVQRLITYKDIESGSTVAVAIVTDGSGGVTLDVNGYSVQTMRESAPVASVMISCQAGDETPLGTAISVELTDGSC